MLDVQTDQHHGWPLAQIDNGAHGAIDTQGIKLLPGSRLDHTVQFFKIETGMVPELWQVKGLKKLEHFGGCLADGRLGGHDCFVKGGTDFNPHRPTSWQALLPAPGYQQQLPDADRSGMQ